LDLSDEHLAPEAARTETAISFTKGCYLGQEPIARIDALGHINRELCRLKVESDTIPESGDEVVDEGGQVLGVVSSAARITGVPGCVAMGCLRTGHRHPGTSVRVRSQNQELAARVF
jgi:folate-binding protein YgfZ